MNMQLADTNIPEVPSLEEILVPEDESAQTPFTIDTPEKAAWAARKILTAEDRISHLAEQSKHYKSLIDSWFEKSISNEIETVDYLKNLIRPFAEQEVLKLRNTKTIHLPGLKIQIRKKPDRIEITDKDIAISFCEMNHPDAVVIKKEISKTYLKDLLTKKGEIIPGTHMEPGDNEIYLKDESRYTLYPEEKALV